MSCGIGCIAARYGKFSPCNDKVLSYQFVRKLPKTNIHKHISDNYHDKAMYTLKGVKQPLGGFPRSIITYSIVCLGFVISKHASEANCHLVIYISNPVLSFILKLFSDGNIGINPFGIPSKVVDFGFNGPNRIITGGC